jgi:hypothetical protein
VNNGEPVRKYRVVFHFDGLEYGIDTEADSLEHAKNLGYDAAKGVENKVRRVG